MTRVIGLTGGIATGKSTVAAFFAELGAEVIDADRIVHELEQPGSPVLDAIVASFGREVLNPDGTLDRVGLRERVFRDDAARARLNAIVHPQVAIELARRTEEARARGAPLVVLDIPLLLEDADRSDALRRALGIEGVALVYAPAKLQIERQIARDGCDVDLAQRRLRAQRDIEEKRALADWVIDNSGSLEATREQVRALFERLVTEGEP